MYFEYWHLNKPPFDNVPDPSMYAECHTSMENAIAETLFAIEEGNDCLAVIIGDVGLGKSLSLRIIIDSLSPEKYQIALITNPSLSFVQLLNEIIGQLTGTQCNEKKKVNLLEIFNKLLFQFSETGKKVVILIDEANAITPANLENLRLLTNMQDDQQNLFTMVLAGQVELARRLEAPRRSNLFQRIGTYSRIEKIASQNQLRDYIETRLYLAGGTKPIFSDDTFPLFWQFSEGGVPRLINKIAKLSLKAGETYGLEQINSRIVNQVGKQFEKNSFSSVSRGMEKEISKQVYEELQVLSNRPEASPSSEERGPDAVENKEEIKTAEFPLEVKEHFKSFQSDRPIIEEKTEPEMPAETSIDQPRVVSTAEDSIWVASGEGSSFSAAQFQEEDNPFEAGPLIDRFQAVSGAEDTIWAAPEEASFFNAGRFQEEDPSLLPKSFPGEYLFPSPSEKTQERVAEADPYHSSLPDWKVNLNPEKISAPLLLPEKTESSKPTTAGIFEDFQIENFNVRVHLPHHFVEQALSCNEEDRVKMAGQAAVQAIKKFIEATSTPPSDPVSIWSELRSCILKRLEPAGNEMAA
jgi:type II secretory pathway predicted ATPase ExeA